MPTKKHGRVVLIHGARFRKKDRENFRRLATGFRAAGFNVVLPMYGYLPALLIGAFEWLDRRVADAMAGFIHEDDILVGHSNGATLVYLISQIVHVKGAVLINAALDPNLVPHARFVHVYYNEGDFLTKLSGLIPFHDWGCMGHVGYQGKDHRVVNFDQGRPAIGLPILHGHSDVFKQGKIRLWSRFMAEQCLLAVEKLRSTKWSHHHD